MKERRARRTGTPRIKVLRRRKAFIDEDESSAELSYNGALELESFPKIRANVQIKSRDQQLSPLYPFLLAGLGRTKPGPYNESNPAHYTKGKQKWMAQITSLPAKSTEEEEDGNSRYIQKSIEGRGSSETKSSSLTSRLPGTMK